MKRLLSPAIAGSAILCAVSAPSFSAESTGRTVTQALSEGAVNLGFRSRFEDVDTGATNVHLLTLRSRLTYTSASFSGFSALLEMDDVSHFSDFEGGIADPEGTEINRATLSYTAADTTIKYGRQRILLDNQRFVGGVGFRQNEQTYDGIVTTNNSLPDTVFFVANINNVNRIFGEAAPSGDHENDTILLNVNYAGWSAGEFTFYGYSIDNEDALAFSSDTYGLRFSGKAGVFSYVAEYATQSDAADNPATYDANYMLAEGGTKLGPVNLSIGYEVLGTDGGNGRFITPLATLHAFQGWTDVFLGGGTGNVPGGIEDVYVKAGAEWVGLDFLLKYHTFGADDASVNGGVDDYGSEIGIQIAKNWKHYGLSLKYADYRADNFAADTKKLWVTATAKF